MSLVSDALKKAERDAALREAREKGLPAPLVAPGQPFRARPRRAPLALLAVGGALAVTALLAFGRIAFGPAPAPPAGSDAPTTSAAPPGNPAPGAVGAERLPSKGEAGAAGAGPSGPRAPEASPGISPPGVTSSSNEAPPPQAGSGAVRASSGEAPPSPPAGQRSQERGASPLPSPEPLPSTATKDPAPGAAAGAAPAGATERVFVRTATLPGGAEIRLGGIAWSATAPLAYLNGRLVGAGEFVAGWRVERIERERVVLADDSGRIAIALR